MRYVLLTAMLLGLVSTSLQAQTYKTKPKQNPAFAEVIEDPSLPRVLIIGDSISIGYTPALRELMKGEANIHRIPANGGPTTRGVANIDSWLRDGNWDVIHFNWGLHDLVYMDKDGKRTEAGVGQHQVPIEEYEENLRKLVKRLKQTDAALIWRNTTPVPKDSRGRIEGEEKPYNEVAAKIMAENGIPTDDHHTYVMQHMAEVQKPNDVHFTTEGSARLAELAAKAIRQELKKQDKQE